MRDVALVPQRDVLEARYGGGTDDSRKSANPLGDDRVPLVGHRGGALLPARKRLLDFAHLRPRKVPDLERELVQRRGRDRERRQ
jgi:hypothetical protein